MANALAVALKHMDGGASSARPVRVAFGGAAQNRLTRDWRTAIMSANHEVRWHNILLRARARQLVRDNPHASGFIAELATQVVGPDGIMLQAKIKNAAGALNRATNQAIEDGWAEWGQPATCSADGHDDWVDKQRTVLRTIATDGEYLGRKIPYADNPFAFTLQDLDADLLDENYNLPPAPDRNEIVMGVEVDGYFRPVAYHLWDRHPTELGKRVRVRVPADEILHLFVRYRVNQTRGVTWFAPVLLDLKQLDGYEEAELVAARIAAAKMGFVLNKTAEAVENYDPPADGEDDRVMSATPGEIDELGPGQEFVGFDPTHPSTAYKEFTKAVLRSVARGLNMSYTTLTGDLEAVNYSSIRAGLLSERDHFRYLQRFLVVQFCMPVYRSWVRMALLAGALRVDSRLASNFHAVQWKPRGWKWVDPVNDLTAAMLAIALRLDNRSRLAAEQGRDFEEMADELAYEEDYLESIGLDVYGPTATTGSQAPPDTADAGETGDTSGDTSRSPAKRPPPDEQKDARAAAVQRARQLIHHSSALVRLSRGGI